MNRRDLLMAGTAAVAFGLSGYAGMGAGAGDRSDRPNIILCMTDDQGWGKE